MTLRRAPIHARGDLLDGRFVVPRAPDGEISCVSPADLDDTIGRFPTSTAHAAGAIEISRRAFPAWRRAKPDVRATHLRAYATALAARRERLTVAISRAIGKPLWESATEVDAMIAKIEITLGPGLELVQPRAVPEVGGVIRHLPVGVCVVIGPFNFPGHLANGHIVPALATGNTVVFKPSERAPEVGEIMAECVIEAGFPPGVIQVVQGGADVARALLEQDEVDGVMFTGSTRVGSAILAQCAPWPGRMVALELGGKNCAIVLADADLAYTAREIAFAAYVTAGQRCTATSRVLVEQGCAAALLRKLEVAARETRIGTPDDEVFLGPVITEEARRSALEVAMGMAKHYEPRVAAHATAIEGARGYYLAPSLYVLERERALASETERELFAPILVVEIVANVDEAIERANRTRYGLAASVFTASETTYDRIAPELEVGVCNWNRGTVGSSSKLPFGGVKESGNHRAAGLYSTYYCVDPVAELRVANPVMGKLPTGLRVGD